MRSKVLILVATVVTIDFTFAGIEGYIPKVGEAAQALAAGTGMRYQYALDVLGGLKIDGTSRNDPIKATYPKMSDNDKFGVVMLMLATNDFDGEHSFNFRQMVDPDKVMLATRIKSLNRKNVDEFLSVFDLPFDRFAERCERYFGIKPPL